MKIPLHPQLEEYLLGRPSSDSGRDPLFPTLANAKAGGGLGLSSQFKRIMERAGIAAGEIRARTGKAGRSVSALSFHSLRHGFTSALANAGVPVEVRQLLTGHASLEQNLHYSHHEFRLVRDAVSTLPWLPKGGG